MPAAEKRLKANETVHASLAQDLARTKDADDLVCSVVHKVIELVGTEGGCAGIRHPAGLVCHKYFRKGETLPMEYCFPPNHGLPGWLILNKVPYLTNDADSDPQIRHELCEMYGIRSALSTPILDAEGEVIAFFELHNKLDGSGFGAKDQGLLTLVSQIASIALQKVLAYSAESTVSHIEERLRLFGEAVHDCAIFMLDPDGRVSSWNTGAERIKGYTASEIIGKHFSCFFLDEDLRSGGPRRELEGAAREGRFEDEGWRVRKGGSRFWANVIVTAVRDDTGRLIGFGKITRDFTERMKVQEELRQANTELANEVAERKSAERNLANSEQSIRKLALHLLRTQDEERRRIGRDLHDSLGQYLAVLKMNLDSLTSILGSKEDEAAQQVAQCVRLAEESIREVRTISYLLYPPMLEEVGLKSAIAWYVDGFAERSNIQTTFEVSPDFGRLARDVELAVFRVLQESLTNVHRHSGSSTASVQLSMTEGLVLLEIKDKGKGIPSKLLEEVGRDWLGSLGVGLRGMNQRMQQLGGKLGISSTEQGTTITATVPLAKSAMTMST